MSDKNDGFKVDAQGYGVGNYVKQYLSPSGLRRAVTESVSPKFEERMETLREADKGMRETAQNLKSYLSSAQKAFKDNRYLDVAHWCAQIDAGVRVMVQEGKPVVDLRDAEIAEFYTRYEDAEPEHNYFASADDGFVATAGVLDRLFGNSIEKLYWKKVKESKLAVQSLIKRAEKLIAIVLSCLGRMGDARAKGNIAAWIEDLQRMGKAQAEFQVFARGIYDKHLKQLADIVKANKPKPEAAPLAQAPSNSKSAPPIPEASKAEEAAELVEEAPVVPEVVAPKREPGRPTVDEAAKKKEMAQIEQLQNLLKNPVQPAAPAQPVTEVNKPEAAPSEIIPVEAPVEAPIEAPKAEEAKSMEPMLAGPNPVAPEIGATPIKDPIIPQAPKAVERPKAAPIPRNPVVNFESQKEVPTQVAPPAKVKPEAPPSDSAVSSRPRGRPRLYPKGESPTDIKKREREERRNKLQGLVQAPVKPVEDSVIPEPPIAKNVENIQTPVETVAPSIPSMSKPKPVSVPTEKPKTEKSETSNTPSEEKVDLHKKVIEAPAADSDKKMTFVLLPRIKPDNLDVMQYKLMKELGHPVKFVTKEDGAGIAKDYMDAGWDIQPMTYDEVKSIEEKNKNNPLEMLDDPEFLASLPRHSNGLFDKGRLINDDGQTIQGGKVVSVPSKYPDFQNLDPKMRKAVIDKLNKLEEDPVNVIVPVKKEKSDKSKPAVETTESSTEKTPEEVKTPEVKTPVKPLEEEIEEEPTTDSEEDKDMKIYMHGDEVERLAGKPMKDITQKDVWNLINTREYWDSLPKMPNDKKKYDVDLIAKFPEIQLLKTDDFDGTKTFFSTLRGIERGNPLPKAKPKVATVEESVVKYSHEKFFNELQKVANVEDYGLMAAMMCAYSEEIESYDLETSVKLLKAAEKLV